MERRSFLKLSCGLGAGILLSSLGVSVLPIEAFAQELTKYDRIKTAKQSTSICCYCAVGCGLLCSTDTKTGKIINIEGDPEHPINEGSLCAKGAGIYQTTAANDRRLNKVLYRAPYGDKWEEKDWDFAIDRIARHLKEERDAGFVKKNAKGADRQPCRVRCPSGQLQRRQRRVLVHGRLRPLLRPGVHRSPGPGLTRPHCTGSGRVVRTRRDDESLDRSPAQ